MEWHSDLPDLDQVAGLVLSPAEMGRWRLSPSSEMAAGFFDRWTLKESYSKARGIGLGLPFDQIGFHRDPKTGIVADFGPELDDEPAFWRFWQPQIYGRHSVAVAANVGAGNVTELELEVGPACS